MGAIGQYIRYMCYNAPELMTRVYLREFGSLGDWISNAPSGATKQDVKEHCLGCLVGSIALESDAFVICDDGIHIQMPQYATSIGCMVPRLSYFLGRRSKGIIRKALPAPKATVDEIFNRGDVLAVALMKRCMARELAKHSHKENSCKLMTSSITE